MATTAHPGFQSIYARLQRDGSIFRAWKGMLFRFQSVDYPQPGDVLNGAGAKWRGGRWNAPGIAAVYGSTTDEAALAECKAHDHYYGVETYAPRLLVAVEARIGFVLDLTSATTRRRLGLTVHDWNAEDWRQIQEAGYESLSQAIGRAVFEAGGGGLLAPSAAVRHGVNVVVFPPRLGAADTLKVLEGEKLERLTRK